MVLSILCLSTCTGVQVYTMEILQFFSYIDKDLSQNIHMDETFGFFFTDNIELRYMFNVWVCPHEHYSDQNLDIAGTFLTKINLAGTKITCGDLDLRTGV